VIELNVVKEEKFVSSELIKKQEELQ